MVGARLVATIAAKHAAFEMDDSLWYGYWYGVVPVVVGTGSPAFEAGNLVYSLADSLASR